MATNFQQYGSVVQWTNGTGSSVASGKVVKLGNILGVALMTIAAGAVGPVAIRGVFTVPKVSGAVIAQGESLVWDVSANSGAGEFDDNAATPATGDVSGPPAVAFEAAGNGVTSLAVLFTGVPGTVT
jgi:predicted RecA/RadA family phage recombinase